MLTEQLGTLFLQLLPSLRDLVHVPQGFDKEDALHEALVDLLADPGKVPEDTAGATQAIREAVIRASKNHLRERTYSRSKNAPPWTWTVDGRFIGQGAKEAIDEKEDSISRIPDPAPSVESTLLRQEQLKQALPIALAIEADPGPKGILYRMLFVEGKKLGDVAQRLGISYTNAKQRLYLLRKELREAYEAEIR